ncbi:MAG TPA: class I lanthipeptide [Thermoanaerobaculia bacterium]
MKKKLLDKRISLHRETLQDLDTPGLRNVAGGDTNSVCSDCLRVCLSWFSGCC